jgi:elongation factor G
MHLAAARGEIVPVMCCAATTNVGVDRILDAVTELMPGPTERPSEVEGSLAALVFKTIADPYVGKLTFLRIFRIANNRLSRVQLNASAR